jgi:hypothetical protein
VGGEVDGREVLRLNDVGSLGSVEFAVASTLNRPFRAELLGLTDLRPVLTGG